jgi:hypothetical protein
MKDDRKLLDVLKAELVFLQGGGYSNRARFPWRPNFVFEDSPTCLKYGAKEQPRPCSDCLLMQFVPEDRKRLSYPCRQIPLTPDGETVTHFYECGTEQELEAALKAWLQRKISELETGEKAQTHDA